LMLKSTEVQTIPGHMPYLRLDIASGKFEVFEPFPVPRPNI
jgi:hypothetical protein